MPCQRREGTTSSRERRGPVRHPGADDGARTGQGSTYTRREGSEVYPPAPAWAPLGTQEGKALLVGAL